MLDQLNLGWRVAAAAVAAACALPGHADQRVPTLPLATFRNRWGQFCELHVRNAAYLAGRTKCGRISFALSGS